jgi:hypothetical protein
VLLVGRILYLLWLSGLFSDMKISLPRFSLLASIHHPAVGRRRHYLLLSSHLVMWAHSKGWVGRLFGRPCMCISVGLAWPLLPWGCVL